MILLINSLILADMPSGDHVLSLIRYHMMKADYHAASFFSKPKLLSVEGFEDELEQTQTFINPTRRMSESTSSKPVTC